MIYDPTLKWRRKRSAEINSVSRSREELEVIWGETWDHLQLRRDFNRFFFANPILICFDRKTGQQGTLLYQYAPRVYFRWLPFSETE
jgi:hypothetical protein